MASCLLARHHRRVTDRLARAAFGATVIHACCSAWLAFFGAPCNRTTLLSYGGAVGLAGALAAWLMPGRWFRMLARAVLYTPLFELVSEQGVTSGEALLDWRGHEAVPRGINAVAFAVQAARSSPMSGPGHC